MMRRAVLVALLLVVSASASMALTDLDLLDVSARMQEAAGRNFQIAIDGSQEMNACAYPDGRILVTQGMLEALDRHDQLAFVLGHEMTHILRRHGYGQVKKTIAGMILGAIVAKALGGDGDTVRTSAEVGGSLFGAKRSRKDEFGADSGGINLAYKAGYNPEGAISSMRLLQSRYGNGMAKAPVLGWFSSHPDTGERVRNLEKVAATLPQRAPEQQVAAMPDQPLPPEDALINTAEPAPAPTPTVLVVQAEAPKAEPTVETPAQPEHQPRSAEPVVETPIQPEHQARSAEPVDPNDYRLNIGAAFAYTTPNATGIDKVEFHWLNESGREFRTFNVKPGMIMGIMVKELAGNGKVTMRVICRDSSGKELSLYEKNIVIVE